MRAVVQRVERACVRVVEDEQVSRISAIERGLLILLGVGSEDTEEDARILADKIANLRVLEDEAGKLNLSLLDTGGAALVVSNFTLYGDCRKGRRPSFVDAARGEFAETLYLRFGAVLSERGVPTQYGQFGAQMQVELVNDGPITLLLDSKRNF